MQFVSGEQDTTPVDPSKPKDPGEAMSRENIHIFSLWDEEQHRTSRLIVLHRAIQTDMDIQPSFRETALLCPRNAVSRVEKCQVTKIVQFDPEIP